MKHSSREVILHATLASAIWLSIPSFDAQAGAGPIYQTQKKAEPSQDSHGKSRKLESKNVVSTAARSSHSASATTNADDPYADEDVPKTNDALEKVNRGTFKFNHQFYRFVARPVAKATVFIIPTPVLSALGNVLENLESPVRITSCLLQAKGKRAAQETGKLLLNSTLGVGGLWKPSDRMPELKDVPAEDVGQAFGKWGVPPGPYLVLPVLGPSSARDAVGKVGDSLLHPSVWVHVAGVKTAATATQAVVENPDRMEAYDTATQDAVDPYIGMREAFTSYRAAAIRK